MGETIVKQCSEGVELGCIPIINDLVFNKTPQQASHLQYSLLK